jgi:hypothetical protein
VFLPLLQNKTEWPDLGRAKYRVAKICHEVLLRGGVSQSKTATALLRTANPNPLPLLSIVIIAIFTGIIPIVFTYILLLLDLLVCCVNSMFAMPHFSLRYFSVMNDFKLSNDIKKLSLNSRFCTDISTSCKK